MYKISSGNRIGRGAEFDTGTEVGLLPRHKPNADSILGSSETTSPSNGGVRCWRVELVSVQTET